MECPNCKEDMEFESSELQDQDVIECNGCGATFEFRSTSENDASKYELIPVEIEEAEDEDDDEEEV